MNEDDLERRLAALRPAALPPELQACLAEPPVGRGKIRWLWAIAPLSAAALLLLAPAMKHPASPAPAPIHTAKVAPARTPQASDFHVYLPVKETSTLVGVEDVAVVNTGPNHPVRLVRATWIDDVTYAGDDGQSTIHRRQPRAQIIPISLSTY
ncbi:MAG TPA: hypothetical protein VGM54_06890 [Chthoniobacter sp.]|jgi:hypothetical protein